MAVIRKDMLHDTIRKCLSSASLTEEEATKFKRNLKNCLQKIWISLASNNCGDTDSWLLHSRAAVLGLYYLSDNNKIFYATMQYLCELQDNGNEVHISDLELGLFIETPSTFQVSVFYGLMSIFLIHKELLTEEFKYVYKFIHDQCRQQTRHNQLCFQLLSQYVNNFSHNLTAEDFDSIFETVYHNLDKRDCGSILRNILNKTDNTQSLTILTTALNSMSWKHKQKFILINEILMENPLLVSLLPDEDCVRGLVFAQSKSNLSSAAAKLHQTIVKHMCSELWIKNYYTAFEKILISPKPTICCRNIIKFYITQAVEASHRSFLKCTFEKLLQSEDTPVFTLLSFTVLGIKLGLFPHNYDFKQIIYMGWDHTEDIIRNMSFDIICSTMNVHSPESYDLVRHFILLNINEADQASRDSIKKSYIKFLNEFENFIVRLEVISDQIPAIIHSSKFFSWLILFLLNQFSRNSNYQRVSLSLTLLNITFTTFSRRRFFRNVIFMTKFREYMSVVPVFHSLNTYFGHFVNMLEICSWKETEKIIQMILSEIKLTPIQTASTFALQDLALQYIGNSNMEVAENGMKLLQLCNRVQTSETRLSLNVLKEKMYQQWRMIKRSDAENIIENNSLHSLISLITNTSYIYDSKEYFKFICFLENIVSHLLNVFALRAMLPFNSKFCVGVAKAFKDETSKFHACTVNCLWLILKASCKLAATITIISGNDNITRRSLNIIYSVIQRCYHKGALEVAGDALALIITASTTHNHNIPVIISFLNEIFVQIPQTIEANTIVRRAAETRIVLSTIAVNDKRIHKPLFHKIMNFLMKTLDACVKESDTEVSAPVHSLVLHCFEPLIMDTAVELHIVEYLSTITMISLNSFDSSNWNVRNAALQTFGAVTNKLLGTALSSNGNASPHHATCLEEMVFKYPAIFNYLITRLIQAKQEPQKSLNVIIPIISFLRMSFSRNDVVVNSTKSQMKDLSDTLLNFVDVEVTPNLQIFVLAAKAYIALCNNEDNSIVLQNNITAKLNITNLSNNIFFKEIYLLKILSEKIIDDSETLTDCDNIKYNVLHKLDITLDIISHRNIFCKVISGLLLYRPGMKAIKISDMQANLLFLNSRPDITNLFPGIWECMANKIQLIISYEDMSKVNDLIKVCLLENISMNLKVVCLKTVQNRINSDKRSKEICEKELINTLIEFLHIKKYISFRFVTEECINLLLNLNVSHVNEEWKNHVLEDIKNIKENLFADTYTYICVPVFCSIYESYNDETLKSVFEFCVENCLKTLEIENPDFLIVKSLIFICKYAKKNKMYGIMVQNLLCIYKLFQRGDEEFKKECENIFSYCFETKPKHMYANLLDLLSKDNLLKLVGPYAALQFLVHIYSEQEDEKYGINVFDKKQTLVVETSILEDLIYDVIFDVYKNDIDDKTEFNLWFTEYKTVKSDHKYIDNLARIFH